MLYYVQAGRQYPHDGRRRVGRLGVAAAIILHTRILEVGRKDNATEQKQKQKQKIIEWAPKPNLNAIHSSALVAHMEKGATLRRRTALSPRRDIELGCVAAQYTPRKTCFCRVKTQSHDDVEL